MSPALTTALTVLGSIVVALLGSGLIQWAFARKDKKREDALAIKTQLEQLNKDIKTIAERSSDNENNMNLQNEALLAICHDRIIYLCERFLKRKSISSEEWVNLKRLADSYKALKGNGLVKEKMDLVEKLPRKEK